MTPSDWRMCLRAGKKLWKDATLSRSTLVLLLVRIGARAVLRK
jgi:hypothetical protein